MLFMGIYVTNNANITTVLVPHYGGENSSQRMEWDNNINDTMNNTSVLFYRSSIL